MGREEGEEEEDKTRSAKCRKEVRRKTKRMKKSGRRVEEDGKKR